MAACPSPLGIAWPLIADLPYAVGRDGDTVVIRTPGGDYRYDQSLLLPSSGPLPVDFIGPDSYPEPPARTFALTTFAPGLPLEPAQAWPAGAAFGPAGPWLTPLFPGADQDLFELGFTPLAALQELRRQRPDAAAALDAGCIARFEVEARTPPRGIAPTRRLANVTFDIQGTATGLAAERYVLPWHELPAGGRAFGLAIAAGPGTAPARSCDEREGDGYPSWNAAAFLRLANGVGAAPLLFTATELPSGRHGDDGYVAIGEGTVVTGDVSRNWLTRVEGVPPEKVP